MTFAVARPMRRPVKLPGPVPTFDTGAGHPAGRRSRPAAVELRRALLSVAMVADPLPLAVAALRRDHTRRHQRRAGRARRRSMDEQQRLGQSGGLQARAATTYRS